jgi:hypothetical protein
MRLPQSAGQRLIAVLWKLGNVLGRWPRWLLTGCLIGAGPMLLKQHPGLAAPQVLSGLLLLPCVLAAALRDWTGRGMLIMATAFIVHCAAVIGCYLLDPDCLPQEFPAGEAYWRETHSWLITGLSAEYDAAWWLPAHLQSFCAVCLLAYTSLGAIPVIQGFHEVDLMNAHVARLLRHSHDPWTALVLGWHPWSICRGVGYMFVIYEVSSLSLARLLGVSVSTACRRRRRWFFGLGLLFADGMLKFLSLELVRQVLQENLAGRVFSSRSAC